MGSSADADATAAITKKEEEYLFNVLRMIYSLEVW
jgi:hypothetical protein